MGWHADKINLASKKTFVYLYMLNTKQKLKTNKKQPPPKTNKQTKKPKKQKKKNKKKK